MGHLGETGTIGEQGEAGFVGPKGSRGTIGPVVRLFYRSDSDVEVS